ncbi:adventurous gliding motility lipoprotein CglB [Archangium lipolyticum]|uniref:adventurous gliding motility lipoprotein CglB n=1 Tax=Archangium lipolyticum TaxID=2970465 RepID=UPI00214A8234|nr:adventurous gliding motility lipoprotein CglB [Archangium lipolyticum]
MRAKLNLLSALVVGTLGGVLATGCQTYDFEPVEPLAITQTTETRRIEARERKPNLMLLVDTSGSMTAPADPSLAACKRNNVTCGDETFQCPIASGCDTRWSALQKAMGDFLGSSGTIARFGLTTYPSDDYCGSTGSVAIPLPTADKEDDATLDANAKSVLAEIQSITTYATPTNARVPIGGTPTGLSLEYVGKLPELQTDERSDFVVVLTDGLPNCNAQFPTPYPNAGCFCTLEGGCEFAPEDGCLDKDASVAAVEKLRAKNIQTIVIGFGADFNAGSEPGRRGAATLDAMARAGGFARTCKVDLDCGTGDTCDKAAGLCNRGFYQAANRSELVNALKEIGKKIGSDPCLLTFDPEELPTTDDLVVVYLNGERLDQGPDTWTMSGDTIRFTGSVCSRLGESTPANPANIEVRAVRKR